MCVRLRSLTDRKCLLISNLTDNENVPKRKWNAISEFQTVLAL